MIRFADPDAIDAIFVDVQNLKVHVISTVKAALT